MVTHTVDGQKGKEGPEHQQTKTFCCAYSIFYKYGILYKAFITIHQAQPKKNTSKLAF